MVSDEELERINKERAQRGLPPLTREQANQVTSVGKRLLGHDDQGFDWVGFLIGYQTGIPWPSAGGILGAMAHPSSPAMGREIHNEPAPSYSTPTPDPSPSYDSSPSNDSGNSDSGSSGGDSGGGGSDGGGGGGD